ncbi:MAG: MBL fold metallo-hydrolase [Phycisphaerales bacterium]
MTGLPLQTGDQREEGTTQSSTRYTLDGASAALCVLASGSRGNCSVLVVPSTPETPRRVYLIDAGLSPTRTRKLLDARGIRPDEVDEIVFTHLDTDHCYAGWTRAMRPGSFRAKLRIHRTHMGRAERMGLLETHAEPFDNDCMLSTNVRMHTEMLAHDSLGVACFRFVINHPDKPTAHLGFATDCGRVTPGLIEHMRGVDTLAIESNYCPTMQEESGRPAFLKKRIMGGSGHLSNQLSAHAVTRINPRQHLVLLHLSQQCNTPEIAASEHSHSGIIRTISTQKDPTPWIPIHARQPGQEVEFGRGKFTQQSLFSSLHPKKHTSEKHRT